VSARRQIAQLTSRYAIAALGLRAAIGVLILADRLEPFTMNLLFRSGLLAFLCAVTLLTTPAFGQTPNVRYRISTAAFPAGVSRPTINDMNNLGVIVGYAANDDAFVCDLHGAILSAGLHWLDDLMQVPQDWSAVHCVGINDAGLIVGLFDRPGPAGTVRGGFILDLNSGAWTYSPNPWNSSSTYGRRVNVNGVIAGTYRDPITSIYYGYLYEPVSGALSILKDPTTDQPLALASTEICLSNHNEVLGLAAAGSSAVLFRLTPGQTLELFPALEGSWRRGINDQGMFAGTARTTVKRTTSSQAFRYETAVQLVAPANSGSIDLNSGGDVLVGFQPDPFVYQDGLGLFNAAPLVTREANTGDLAYWNAVRSITTGGSGAQYYALTERDTDTGSGNTGFAEIGGMTTIMRTVGKGKTSTITYEYRLFVLTPEIP
jgi:hypothetical protein